MKHKLLIIITLSLSLNLYSQIDEKNLINKDIYVKNDSLSLMTQSASDEWLAEYIKVTHAKLLQESSEKTTRASVCNNLDFEEGNFTGWTCQTGLNNGYPAGPWTGSLPVANRHTIETGGTDPYGGFPRVAPGGGNFSVRLGNNGVGAQAERIIFSFIVGPEDTNFIYKYAVVFQDPGHSHEDQPYFELKILNSLNQVIACGQQHYTAASNIPGFLNAGGNVWYKPWTTVGIRLADYVGQPVTVIVTNADCSLTGHFGYGYVDFICPHNLVAQANTFCEYDNAATLSVPNISPGATYLWSTGETTPTININPQNFNDSTIQCYVTPPDVPTGCGFWYTFPIKILHIDPNFSFNASCLNAEFFDSTLINYGNVTYWQWDFGDGNVSNVQNPIHSYSTSGTYNVTLSSGTPQCQSSITFPVNAIDFDLSITKVDATCYGYSDGQATAVINGGTPPFTFQWSNGESTQDISNLTAGNYSITVSDNNGCVHNASITINQPPQLTITATTDKSTICYGDSVILTVSGANTYLWSNGLGSNSNVIAYPTTSTTYSVTGTNVIGCTATTQININVNPLPILTANSTPPMICYGESSILSVSGASTYSWSHSLGTGATKTVSPTSSITYTVTGTDFNNCSNTTTVSVAVNPLPTVYISASLDTICYGDVTTLTASGANTYQWNTADNTASITVSPANSTIYTVTGTDINNCSSTASISILVNPLPTVISSATPNIICLGENSIITANGANNYSWSHSLGTGATKTVSPTSSITYTVTGTDFNNCSNTTTVSVAVNPLPTVYISASLDTICYGDVTTLTASGANTYQWNTADNTASITVSPANSTIYTVTGTDINNCSSTASISILVNPLPTVISSATPNIICLGENSIITANGANNYSWSHSLGTGATKTVSPTSSTTYTVTGTDFNNCSNTTTVSVAVNPLPTVYISASLDTICYGDVTTLTASGANTYQWNTADNTASITVSPANSTIYTVTGTDINNCSSTASISILVNPLPTVISSATPNIICLGENSIITANGANNYSWSHSLGTGATKTVSPTSSITYTVTGTDFNNCSNTTTVSVAVNPLPTVYISASLDTICYGDVTTLTASGANTYQWNTADNTASITVSPANSTIYTVTGTDINNCSSTASISILVNPLPTVISSATPNIICLGENSIITANGANNYSWSHSLGTGATKTVSPTSSTIYTITGTDLNNCSNTTTVTVSVNPLPIMSIAMTNSEICFGESTYISASGAMGYQWSNSLGNSSTILVSPNITSTYTVTGTNQYGCTSSLSATVVVNPLPNVIISPDSIEICDNNSVTLTASGAINYLWANGLGTNANITIAPHNNTVYMVTGTNQYGCTNSARAQVIVHPLPVVTINPNSIEICLGDSATLVANGANSYLWNNAMGNNSTIVVSPQITTDYNVTGTNQWGCTSSAYSQVIVHSLPNLSLTSINNTICNGHSTTLCAYGADHYLWSNGSTQPSIIVTPSTTTYYSITGFSIYNCIKIDSILVTVNPTPVVDFVAEPLIGCEPLAVKFINNSDNGTSFWYFGDNYTSNISSPLHVYTSHGTYSVTLIVKNQYNCLDTITKLNYITVYPSPIAGFTVLPNYTSEEDGLVNIIDHSIGATSWYYDFGVENDNKDIFTDKEPKFIYSQAGNYNITQIVSNQYGCLDTSYNSVTVRPTIMFYIANAFTPNEDDKNAFFMPLGFNISPIEYEFRIYDRWGKQLFFTTDFNVGWDGKYNGEFVKQDVYVYMVKVRLENGIQVFRGSVYLLK
jgi:gliding motility-associated-like protein